MLGFRFRYILYKANHFRFIINPHFTRIIPRDGLRRYTALPPSLHILHIWEYNYRLFPKQTLFIIKTAFLSRQPPRRAAPLRGAARRGEPRPYSIHSPQMAYAALRRKSSGGEGVSSRHPSLLHTGNAAQRRCPYGNLLCTPIPPKPCVAARRRASVKRKKNIIKTLPFPLKANDAARRHLRKDNALNASSHRRQRVIIRWKHFSILQKYCKSTRPICCARLFSPTISSIRRIAENSFLADHSQLFAFLSSNREGTTALRAVAPSLYLCILRKHDCRLFTNTRLCSIIESTSIRANLSLHILYIEIQLSVISQTNSFYHKASLPFVTTSPAGLRRVAAQPGGREPRPCTTYPPRTACAA